MVENMNKLSDKVAFITGSGSGIGRAAAMLLAKHGARIGALDMDIKDVEKVTDEIRRQGGDARPSRQIFPNS